MIIDKIENVGLYTGISEKIARGLNVLKNIDLSIPPDVKHEEKDLFYMLQKYKTEATTENKLEAHKKYIDIQYVASGEEFLEYSLIDNLEIVQAYNEQKDVAFYKTPEDVNKIALKSGMFCILFPDDGHNLRIPVKQSTEVLKVLVKLKTVYSNPKMSLK
jgi:YhcH/YjgK/YiaL family protein